MMIVRTIFFVAIDDDHPTNLYDSQQTKNISVKQSRIMLDEEYEFLVNIFPNGIIVSQFIDNELLQRTNYSKIYSKFRSKISESKDPSDLQRNLGKRLFSHQGS
jgi:hypothetical protein